MKSLSDPRSRHDPYGGAQRHAPAEVRVDPPMNEFHAPEIGT
jgi:hypothetical protein